MSLSSLDVFHFLVACHIVTGASGALDFLGAGGEPQGRAGASQMGPRLRHADAGDRRVRGPDGDDDADRIRWKPIPHLCGVAGFDEPQTVRAVFGWMMLYLAVLTVNLAWHGWLCVSPGRVAAHDPRLAQRGAAGAAAGGGAQLRAARACGSANC